MLMVKEILEDTNHWTLIINNNNNKNNNNNDNNNAFYLKA